MSDRRKKEGGGIAGNEDDIGLESILWYVLENHFRNKAELLTLLIDWEAHVNAFNHCIYNAERGCEYVPPLHFLIAQNKLDLLYIFVNNGADANSRDINEGSTPLHLAVEGRNLEIIRLLLKQPQIRLDVPGRKGMTVMEVVSGWSNRFDSITVLLCKEEVEDNKELRAQFHKQ